MKDHAIALAVALGAAALHPHFVKATDTVPALGNAGTAAADQRAPAREWIARNGVPASPGAVAEPAAH